MSEEKQETVVEIQVPEGQQPDTRLDVYLTRALPNATRSKVQRGIREGRVQVNDKVVTRPAYIVQPGDRITCRVLRPLPVQAAPEPIPLDVLFEDEHLLVVNKPPGMVVHPAYGHRKGTLVNALLHHLGGGVLDASGLEEGTVDVDLSTRYAGPRFEGDPTLRPGIVHRLDKDTSGVLVVAKDDVTHARLSEQFMNRSIDRTYQAILWGVPTPEEGTIEGAIGRDPRDRKRMAVVAPERGKAARTHYRVIEALPYTSLVQFKLETGRTHQIRVHARYIGHPVLGDPTYGGQRIVYGPDTATRRAFFRRLFERMPRQALHAATLGFRHPHTGEQLFFEAPMPEDMLEAWQELRRVEGLSSKSLS